MAQKNRIPMRFFTTKGVEVDYDYFSKCFSTFDTLVVKAQQYMPGIESAFIKFLLKENKYKVGGYMLKADGTKIRLYYLAWLCQLLLLRDSAGFYKRDEKGNFIWKPKAWEYYQNWKSNNSKPVNNISQKSEDHAKRRAFLDNISRYDPDMRNDDDED